MIQLIYAKTMPLTIKKPSVGKKKKNLRNPEDTFENQIDIEVNCPLLQILTIKLLKFTECFIHEVRQQSN